MKSKFLSTVLSLSLFAGALLVSTPLHAARSDSNYFTYDIGLSRGSSGGRNYNEGNLGLNYWFTPSIAWRNSIFGRQVEDNPLTTTVDEKDETYGIDTSIRGRHYFEFSQNSGATLFVGPGYRFASKGKNAPIAEGGLIFRLGSLSVGGGVKTIFRKLVDPSMEDETQYFIVLSGGGRL